MLGLATYTECYVNASTVGQGPEAPNTSWHQFMFSSREDVFYLPPNTQIHHLEDIMWLSLALLFQADHLDKS